MPSWVWLLVQVILALTGMRVLQTMVLPAIRTLDEPGAILDVWLPLIVCVPMWFVVGLVRYDASGAGWLAVGAPVVCAWIAVGAALFMPALRETSGGSSGESGVLLRVASAGAGLVLLLLAAANDLTVLIGQFCFAIGAVLLWMNTPAASWRSDESTSSHETLGLGVLLSAGCAIGQGIAVFYAGATVTRVSGGLLVAYACVVLASVAAEVGRGIVVRVAGWVATYGVMFGLGIQALFVLMPAAWRSLTGPNEPTSGRVSYGFGFFATEALLLLLLVPAARFIAGLPTPQRRALALAVLIAAAGWAAWRLTGIESSAG